MFEAEIQLLYLQAAASKLYIRVILNCWDSYFLICM